MVYAAEEVVLLYKRNSKDNDCNVGIELAETPLSLDKRIQAIRIHYGTKNTVGTVRQFQYECEETSELQLPQSFDGIFSPIINSDFLNTLV